MLILGVKRIFYIKFDYSLLSTNEYSNTPVFVPPEKVTKYSGFLEVITGSERRKTGEEQNRCI